MPGRYRRAFVLPRPEEVPFPAREGIDRSGLFGEVTSGTHRWDLDYSAETYVDVLSTYSDHIAIDPAARARLFEDIAALIDRDYGGRITKEHLTVLCMARRKD